MTFLFRPCRAALACAVSLAAIHPATGVAADNGHGANVYTQHCLFCHGVDLKGIDGIGVDLLGSKLVRDKSLDELVAFLKTGRTPEDPATITGRAMPAFDWITDGDLRAVAEYIRSEH